MENCCKKTEKGKKDALKLFSNNTEKNIFLNEKDGNNDFNAFKEIFGIILKHDFNTQKECCKNYENNQIRIEELTENNEGSKRNFKFQFNDFSFTVVHLIDPHEEDDSNIANFLKC